MASSKLLNVAQYRPHVVESYVRRIHDNIEVMDKTLHIHPGHRIDRTGETLTGSELRQVESGHNMLPDIHNAVIHSAERVVYESYWQTGQDQCYA